MIRMICLAAGANTGSKLLLGWWYATEGDFGNERIIIIAGQLTGSQYK